MVMSNNILQAKVAIRGIRPLFWHRFGRESIPLEKGEKTGVPGNDPEEWRRTVMVTKEGQLYLEPVYAFSTICAGAKYTKKGRGSIQTSVYATLQVTDNRILVDRYMPGFVPGLAEIGPAGNGKDELGIAGNGKVFDVSIAEPPPEDSDAPVYLDVRAVVNPSTKGRNVRYRVVASPGWSCSFTIQWDKTIVSRGEMEASVIDAGKLVGIGNARKIGMGRFEVEAFDVLE